MTLRLLFFAFFVDETSVCIGCQRLLDIRDQSRSDQLVVNGPFSSIVKHAKNATTSHIVTQATYMRFILSFEKKIYLECFVLFQSRHLSTGIPNPGYVRIDCKLEFTIYNQYRQL